MKTRTFVRVGRLMVALGGLVLAASSASAQVLGTFTWQMQPYCNRVSLTLTTGAGGFVLHGVDDRCGATVRGSASGAAVFNGDGSVSLNFAIATAPAGTVVHVSASVSPTTGQGTWSDDLGHSGTFAFDGSIAGLPVRPSSPTVLSVADNPQLPTDPCAVPTARPTMVLCGTAAGHWGVPTMVFDGEPFFGQDRLDLLVWRMRQAGLQERRNH